MTTESFSRPSTRTRGFTLIELLTVIAIIGILASILIPVVGQVRESANRIHCGNNVRQIAMAILTYESEVGHLPGPTRREIRSPLAGDTRPGANVPREDWPQTNVCMSLLLEDYMGRYSEGDPGPFLCRTNRDNTEGDSRKPVYILMRNKDTNPPSFFGDTDFSSPVYRTPKRLEQLISATATGPVGREARELTQLWMVADIDNKIWTNTASDAGMDFGPPHSGGRNMVFFDGHLEYVTSVNGKWPYPANSGQPESR